MGESAVMSRTPGTLAEIVVDLDAVRHNVRRLRELTGVPSMTVVKADGYGHGMVEVARVAREAGSEWIGVATVDEALALRSAGDRGRLLCWLHSPSESFLAAVASDIEIGASSVVELRRVAHAAAENECAAKVQLKVDTGLSRNGAPLDEWPALVAAARQEELDGNLRITGIWSHFAASDEPDHPANDAQEAAFRHALAVAEEVGLRPEVRHLANSAAGILRPSSRFDLVRFGLASYGLDPAPGHTPDLGLVPAMTVHADLVSVKRIHAGDGVSYGHTWIADTDTTVGLVPVGYGDGVPRHASNAAHVLVDGKQRALRGRICMDQFVVDLDGDSPESGSDVLLFGPGRHGEPTAQDWAEAADTISYEIVTRIGGRMTRRYVDQ
jgi:alanine racemase